MTLTWSPAALADLVAAHVYIADESPEQAERVVRDIVRAAEGLTTFPSLGRGGAVRGTRERVMARSPYKIVYRVRGADVGIVRIIHTAQNWP